MERRELLQWMVATGGMAAFNRLSVSDLTTLGHDVHRRAQAQSQALAQAQRSSTPQALRALDARTANMVTIAAERIIPASETPGATQAGVTAFIDTMLHEWYAPTDRDRFLAGLNDLDARAQERARRMFAASTFAGSTVADQIAVLESFDRDVVELRRTNGAANDHWFAMLKYLTVWGYCTSEPGMRQTLKSYPLPMRYDGHAPVRT